MKTLCIVTLTGSDVSVCMPETIDEPHMIAVLVSVAGVLGDKGLDAIAVLEEYGDLGKPGRVSSAPPPFVIMGGAG